MSDHTAAVMARCATITTAYDARVLTAPSGPHVIVYGGTGTPTSRRIDGQAHIDTTTWQAVCVSNNPTGCRTLTAKIRDALDGHRIDDRLLRVTTITHPIEDRDDPTDWRWTSTITVQHYSRRTT